MHLYQKMTADVKVQLKFLGHLSRSLIYSSQNVLGLSYEIQCVSSVREGDVKKTLGKNCINEISSSQFLGIK